MNAEKFCPKCKQTLAINNFRISTKAGKRQPYCIPCMNEYKRERYAQNPEPIKERQRQYQEAHQSQIDEYQKKYREERREELRIKAIEYRQDNKEQVAQRARIRNKSEKVRTQRKARRIHRLANDPSYKEMIKRLSRKAGHKYYWKTEVDRRKEWRDKVFAAYGNSCQCCGESIEMFLTIDHVHNDGATHRKTIDGSKFYKWLIDNNFPDGFQTLCRNCNWGKFRNNGLCPHQKENPEPVS